MYCAETGEHGAEQPRKHAKSATKLKNLEQCAQRLYSIYILESSAEECSPIHHRGAQHLAGTDTGEMLELFFSRCSARVWRNPKGSLCNLRDRDARRNGALDGYGGCTQARGGEGGWGEEKRTKAQMERSRQATRGRGPARAARRPVRRGAVPTFSNYPFLCDTVPQVCNHAKVSTSQTVLRLDWKRKTQCKNTRYDRKRLRFMESPTHCTYTRKITAGGAHTAGSRASAEEFSKFR